MDNDLLKTRQQLSLIHLDDPQQLEYIFSEQKRIIVEAPAGYGKTKTMISKIAYQLATSQVPSPKKFLALTFSVNAAYKIKKDVTEQVPILLDSFGALTFEINDRIVVSNYHGLSRRILKRYGYKLQSNLKNIDSLTTFDDDSDRGFKENSINLEFQKVEFINSYSQAIKNHNYAFLKDNIEAYNDIYIHYCRFRTIVNPLFRFIMNPLFRSNVNPFEGIRCLTFRHIDPPGTCHSGAC